MRSSAWKTQTPASISAGCTTNIKTVQLLLPCSILFDSTWLLISLPASENKTDVKYFWRLICAALKHNQKKKLTELCRFVTYLWDDPRNNRHVRSGTSTTNLHTYSLNLDVQKNTNSFHMQTVCTTTTSHRLLLSTRQQKCDAHK